jgi:hypothetical protein
MSAALRSNIRRLQTSKNRGAGRKLSDGGQGREGKAGMINPFLKGFDRRVHHSPDFVFSIS